MCFLEWKIRINDGNIYACFCCVNVHSMSAPARKRVLRTMAVHFIYMVCLVGIDVSREMHKYTTCSFYTYICNSILVLHAWHTMGALCCIYWRGGAGAIVKIMSVNGTAPAGCRTRLHCTLWVRATSDSAYGLCHFTECTKRNGMCVHKLHSMELFYDLLRGIRN